MLEHALHSILSQRTGKALSSVQPSAQEWKKAFEEHERQLERALRKDRSKLFRALAEFAIMEGDAGSWAHFRRRWPDFFPAEEYDRVTGPMLDVRGSTLTLTFPDSENSKASNSWPSIEPYPGLLNQIWRGGETDPYLEIMLGVNPTTEPDVNWPEKVPATHLRSIAPIEFALDWTTGRIRYQGACDFQRALYLLFRESWRARVCEKCESCFIAKREGQRYCSTDCSEAMQREVKRRWWAEHGKAWRNKKSKSKPQKKGTKHGTQKAR